MFVSERIEAAEFEEKFLRMFKAQQGGIMPQEEFLVLNTLFGDVDAYCSDPGLRDSDDLDKQQLLQRAERALGKLYSLLGQGI